MEGEPAPRRHQLVRVQSSFSAAVRSLQVVKLSNPLSENHKWLVRHNERTNSNAGGDDVDDDDDGHAGKAHWEKARSLAPALQRSS